MSTVLDELERAGERAAAADWAGQAGLGAALTQAIRAERLVTATKLAILGAFDASKEFQADLHPSAATWVAAETRSDVRKVRHQVHVARTMRTMPLVEQAQAEGRIGFDHVAVLARAWDRKVADEFAEAEAELVAAAETLDWDVFTRAVRAWRDFVDPDEPEKRTQENEARRDAHGSWTFDDLFRVDAWLDAIGGTELQAEWNRIERQMFEADWAEARVRVGDKATAADLSRTAGQRRADALVEMARRSAMLDAPSQPPKWVLNVMMGWNTFCAETAQATEDEGRPAEPAGDGPASDDDDPEDDGRPAGPAGDPLRPGSTATDPGPGSDPGPEADSGSGGGPGSDPGPEAGSGSGGGAPKRPPPWWPTPDPMGRYFDTMCELENFVTIAPSRALSLGLAGDIRRVVFGPDSEIIDFGQTKEYFEGPLREAVIIRDRVCIDPGCNVPGRHCHVDHKYPRSKGGPTSITNAQLKCPTGNRLKGDRIPEAS